MRAEELRFGPPIAEDRGAQVSIDLLLGERFTVFKHVTAPKIDPGFIGRITLEMANFGNAPVELRARIDRPAQLLLAPVTTPLEESDQYGAHPTDVFQYQTSTIPRART